jgi:hypothetical protein
LAEDINAFNPDIPYENLIELEIDFARISDSVVIFSEGFGSLAELGAFSQVKEIAARMLVLMQTQHYEARSFIRDGPIRYLEKQYPMSVQVFGWENKVDDRIKLEEASFKGHVEEIKKTILDCLDRIPKKLKFRESDFGHKIILAAAIADMLGAAILEDFKNAFQKLGLAVTESDVKRMLFCASSVGWLKAEQKGHRRFFLPSFDAPPCDFAYKPDARLKDPMRWKRDIREYWDNKDQLRFKLIRDSSRGRAP